MESLRNNKRSHDEMTYDFNQEILDEGSNGIILLVAPGWVEKIGKRKGVGLDILTQIRIHTLCLTCLSEPGFTGKLFAPELQGMLYRYRMRRVDTSNPISLFEMPHLLPEVCSLWKLMWRNGFALYDFELYLQPDGRVAILDFDKTCFRQTNTALLNMVQFPFKVGEATNLNHFYFKHPCFPLNFLETLVGSGGSIEEQIKRVSALPYYKTS